MPRKPLTPEQASNNARAQALAARDAADLLVAILDGSDHFPNTPEGIVRREDAVTDVGRILEAAGCYVRRQHDKALLVPVTKAKR